MSSPKPDAELQAATYPVAVKPWADMDRSEKEEAVHPLLQEGLTYSAIAERLGATSRNSIGTIATSLRQKGAIALVPRNPSPEAVRKKRAARTPAKPGIDAPKAAPKRDKVLRKSASGSIEAAPMRGAKNPHYNDFKARAEQRAASPGLSPELIAGLPTSQIVDIPVPTPLRLRLVELTDRTCRFPHGDPQSADFGFCGNRTTRVPYCAYHNRLAYTPPTIRHRAEIRSAERKFA